MLFRLVRPVRRSGSSFHQFTQRIPADVIARAAGLRLAVPLGDGEFHRLNITAKARDVRFSLRTREPSVAKSRHGIAAAFLEGVWRSLRATAPMSLTARQATALAGDIYRAWASEDGERTTAVIHTATGWLPCRADEEQEAAFAAAARRLQAQRDDESDLEPTLDPIVDRLLLRRGISAVDAPSRALLLSAFASALSDAFAARSRNAAGDYTPDPKIRRFPEWSPPANGDVAGRGATVSLRGLLADWWREASATGRKPSTHESYAHTIAAFVSFLGYDEAARVTPADVVRFKDFRLATKHPRTGQPLSPKTVKDSDLAALKTILGWAVTNRKLPSNPAAGITIKLGRKPRLRSKGFTDAEADALLTAATSHAGPREAPQTAAAKRWVPWLCAYTGARVGELAQARKMDLRQEGALWVLRITPDAGTVKTNEARDVVLHPHLIEQGFPAFVAAAPTGHLFLKPSKTGDVRGPLRGLKNRLAEFAREHVADPRVAPNHGWRHRFKTVGLEVGIDHRVLDAMQGQSPRTVGEAYGEVTLKTMAAAMARFPRL